MIQDTLLYALLPTWWIMPFTQIELVFCQIRQCPFHIWKMSELKSRRKSNRWYLPIFSIYRLQSRWYAKIARLIFLLNITNHCHLDNVKKTTRIHELPLQLKIVTLLAEVASSCRAVVWKPGLVLPWERSTPYFGAHSCKDEVMLLTLWTRDLKTHNIFLRSLMVQLNLRLWDLLLG